MSLRDCPWQHNVSKSPAAIAILLSSLVNPIVAFAQQPDSLAGLKRIEVEVSVDIAFRNTDKDTVTERLQRHAERILRESHVPLVEGQPLDDPLGVWLHAYVRFIDLEEDAIVLIDSNVIQGTSLLRDPSVKTEAITWKISSWLIMDKDDAIISAEEILGNHMNMFVKDFLTFNQ